MTFEPRSIFSPLRCAFILAAFATSAGAQDLSQFDKILVPLLNLKPIQGANSSTFGTALDVWSNLSPITYYPAASADGPVIGQSQPQLLQLRPWEAPVIAKGRFVFINGSVPVAAIATAAAPDGSVATTPLPIVRERDVITGKSTFMPLPVDPLLSEADPSSPEHFHLLGFAQRYTLRVYDWDSTGTMEVAVRLIRGFFLAQGAVDEIHVRVDRRDFDHPTYPFYAEVDLQPRFAGWCYPGLHTACMPFPAIIEVEPSNPTARYYAFISMTDNRTNHIAVFTPR
jgi:hypothetical protein